ncbi:hypothetical protein [Liquorilactobacillus satsumensis]|uniref:hypothetical protein n=1 Tax=Liquorilactobacillus satsumensis TaxID=259059 RepID=UPI00345C67A0
MTKTIDLNGKKFVIEEQKVTKVNEFKIGDTVRILDKHYDPATINSGVIIEFLDFQDLPTIRVAVFTDSWGNTSLEYKNINDKSDNLEILPASPDELKIDMDIINGSLDSDIAKKQREVEELKHKKMFFNKFFGNGLKEK